MDYLKDRNIPMEVCPTSNLFTQHFVKVLEKHPIKSFLDHGMNVTLNTDDPTLFGSELINEYMILLENGIFTPAELLKLLKNTHFACIMDEKQKKATWKQIEAIIKKSQWSIAE